MGVVTTTTLVLLRDSTFLMMTPPVGIQTTPAEALQLLRLILSFLLDQAQHDAKSICYPAFCHFWTSSSFSHMQWGTLSPTDITLSPSSSLVTQPRALQEKEVHCNSWMRLVILLEVIRSACSSAVYSWIGLCVADPLQFPGDGASPVCAGYVPAQLWQAIDNSSTTGNALG